MKRRWNLFVWAGFLLVVVAFLSYYHFFARFPVTRDFPWANLLLFAAGGFLLVVGLRRAFGQPEAYRGKIAGSIFAVLSVLIFGLFGFYNFYLSKLLPASPAAPGVGQKAPNFTLPDQNGKSVSLAELLASPSTAGAKPSGVILVFYRGYW